MPKTQTATKTTTKTVNKADKKIVLGQCEIHDHRPCDLDVSIGVAAGVAQQLNLPVYGKLTKIQQKGVTSEAEAEKALRQWATEVRTAPSPTRDQLGWVDTVTHRLWPTQK